MSTPQAIFIFLSFSLLKLNPLDEFCYRFLQIATDNQSFKSHLHHWEHHNLIFRMNNILRIVGFWFVFSFSKPSSTLWSPWFGFNLSLTWQIWGTKIIVFNFGHDLAIIWLWLSYDLVLLCHDMVLPLPLQSHNSSTTLVRLCPTWISPTWSNPS